MNKMGKVLVDFLSGRRTRGENPIIFDILDQKEFISLLVANIYPMSSRTSVYTN